MFCEGLGPAISEKLLKAVNANRPWLLRIVAGMQTECEYVTYGILVMGARRRNVDNVGDILKVLKAQGELDIDCPFIDTCELDDDWSKYSPVVILRSDFHSDVLGILIPAYCFASVTGCPKIQKSNASETPMRSSQNTSIARTPAAAAATAAEATTAQRPSNSTRQRSKAT